MIELKDLLVRFNNILLSEGGKKESVRSAISSVVGIDIKPEDVEIKKNTIYLNIKPIYKNEILLKQEKIISELEKVLGTKAPHFPYQK